MQILSFFFASSAPEATMLLNLLVTKFGSNRFAPKCAQKCYSSQTKRQFVFSNGQVIQVECCKYGHNMAIRGWP